MRILLPLLLLGAVLVPPCAHSQASVDPRALQALPVPAEQKPAAEPAPTAQPAPPPARSESTKAPARSARPAPAKPAAKPPAAKPEASHPAPEKAAPGKPAAEKPAAGKPPGQPQVRLSPNAPPPPQIPPPLAVPMRAPPPPAPTPVVADAPGTAAPVDGGLRITFGTDRADFNPATDTALRELAHAAAPTARFAVAGYAAGIPDDPSTPRRTSLSRALAVRAVLIAEGIASERITVRALGGTTGTAEVPANRVDITLIPSPETPAKPTP